MYIHIGLDNCILDSEIIGVFDLENTTVENPAHKNRTLEYLARAEEMKIVKNVVPEYEIPKSFIVCERDGKRIIYLTQISVNTILKRSSNNK